MYNPNEVMDKMLLMEFNSSSDDSTAKGRSSGNDMDENSVLHIEDSGCNELSVEGQVSKKCNEGVDMVEDDDEDASDDETATDYDEEEERCEAGTTLTLRGIHSAVTQTTVQNYLSEHITGLREKGSLHMDVERDTSPQTQVATLYFDSVASAQGAIPFLSGCPLGPDRGAVKVDFVNLEEVQHSLSNVHQSSVVVSTDKKRRQMRSRPKKRLEKTQAKTKPFGRDSKTPFSSTVKVKNICVHKELFLEFLTRQNVSSYQHLQWTSSPHDNQAVLQFTNREDAVSAQRILSSCSVGAANKKLIAELQDSVVKTHDVRQTAKQRGTSYSERSRARVASSSAPSQVENAPNLAERSERRERHGNDTGKCSRRGGLSKNSLRSEGQQNKSPNGACYIPHGERKHTQGKGHPHQRNKPPGPEKLPQLMELSLHPPAGRLKESKSSYCGCDDDERASVISDLSSTSAPPKATSLHVTNIDPRVQEAGFRQYLSDTKIPFTDLEFRISREQKHYAVIHFASTKETAKFRQILNKRQILPDGTRMHATFTKSFHSNIPSKMECTEDRQSISSEKNVHGRPGQLFQQGGNRNRDQGRRPRNSQRNRDKESDMLSHSSEVLSIASRKSFASSSCIGKHPQKSSSLLITNIGEDVDEEEFYDFLESLKLECECLEFSHAKISNTKFAVVLFPDCKKATDAKTFLNSDNWILGGSPVEATFSISGPSPGRNVSMETDLLKQLEDEDDSQSNVQKWLKENEAMMGQDERYLGQSRKSPGRRDLAGRGRNSRGRGSHGNQQERGHSVQGRDGQGFGGSDSTHSGNNESEVRKDGRQQIGKGDRHDSAGRKRGDHRRGGRGNHGSDPGVYENSGQTEGGKQDAQHGTDEKGTSAAVSKASQGRKKGISQDKKQTSANVTSLTLGDQKVGNRNQSPKECKWLQKSNEIVVSDLPKDISELDIVNIVKKEQCDGFQNAELINDKEGRSRTCARKCYVEFRQRQFAMDAVLKLYGKPIRGHRVQVKLSVNHEQLEPAIAQKTLASFQEDEMSMRVDQIESVIRERIERINLEIMECKEALEENLPFAELERCESSTAALELQLCEQQRFLDEFKIACDNIEEAICHLQEKEVLALSEVQQIRQHFERECRRAESPLPVYGYRSDIQKMIRENTAIVLQGETGSGKSTQIPQYVVDMELQGRHGNASGGDQPWRVVCTQPRRVAALTLAKRVAEEYGCRIGEEVGCLVGNTKSVNKNTVVTFMTDRKLLNLCMQDPNLSDYTCVIVDEAHERSVDTDILLATLKKLLRKRRDLHLLIMSATIDIKLFTDYLGGCEKMCIPGRTFPVDKHWCGDDVGIGEGDYLAKAVQCAAKVHKNEDSGDILVFLTSANEIETACRDLATALGQRPSDPNSEVLILPLHGRLQPEDQMKVFADTRPGQRKIVFATNVAETSVTIKGIKYVIDTGVVKECQYDPKRSMSLLKVTTITRASAEQRAGRAGRTGPGVCYRLYTKEEYSELEETMKPEILRVHLGMAALQLLELGVEDVENFDFIQAPDREATRQAMTTLRLLGAVDEQTKLTPLGRKMATLPLEPRLSKLVLEGVKRGLALEAVIIAALISAPGSIFYRGGSDKDKEKADRLKLKFCHESGDIITMLIAYGQWNNQPENKQKAWCMENSMNSKILRATKETVKEVLQVLKREHKVSCNLKDKMEAPDKAKREALQKIILSGYFQTLSLYNGHQRAGYTVLPQQKSAHVHPSSALKALGSNPKWVVYEEFKRTSRDFLFNITQVDVSWLDDVAPVFSREIDLDALQETAMEEQPSVPLGTALMRQLIMKRNEKIRALEEKITAEQDLPCIIEIDRSAKELHVFVNRQCSLFAMSYVQRFLDNERRMMERQQIEVPVGESGVVRQVIIAGAVTGFILMAKDYRSLEISNMPDDATEDDVERVMHFAGCAREEVLDVYRFPEHVAQGSKWGRVTFISPEAAESAKMWLDAAVATEETSLTVKPIQGRGFQRPDVRRVNSRVVVTWFVWPSKGHAFINCESVVDAVLMKSSTLGLRLKGSLLSWSIPRKNPRALFIKNINPHATQEELEKAIKRRTNIPFTKCLIVREEPKLPIPTPEEVTRDVCNMFDGAVPPDEMKIDILPVKSERTQMHKAIVTFSGDNEGRVDARVADIENNPRYNSMGQMYHAKITASCMLFCSPEVYDCLEEEIERLVDTAKNEKEDLLIRVNRSRKTRDWVISISSGKIQDVHVVRRSLLAYVQGEKVPLSDLYQEQMTHLKRSRVLEILQNGIGDLLRGLDAHATVDARRQVTVIFGRDTVREELKGRLRDYVQLICDNMLKEIPLTVGLSPHCTKGRVIRALVKAYGPWLKKLQDKSRARQITLNTRQGVLLIEGDQSVFDKVHGMVYDCLKEAGLEGAIVSVEEEKAGEEVECGICYTPVEGNQEIFRLTACTHGFHQECLLEMFKVRLKDASKDYPIECPYEDCGSAMLLCDIRILCPNEDKRLRLYQLALEAHVTQKSNGELKFCPTADCNMIYKTTKDAQTFVCPECRSRLCSSCAEEPHPGQTCEEFKISGKNFGGIEQWIRESDKDVKKCPVPACGYTIERDYGCNHMTCLGCKKHICWVCLEYFSSSGACYGHLESTHGGYV